MKQQSNTEGDGDESDFMKYRKYCDEFFEKSITNNNNNRYGANANNHCYVNRESEPNKIDEMQMTLLPSELKKSGVYASGWSESNNARITSELAESPVYSNLCDIKNDSNSKVMSPITTSTVASPAFTSNDSFAQREYYYLNAKPKMSGSMGPAKKPRFNDSRYQVDDFRNSTDGGSGGNQTDKLTLQSEKSETVYEGAHTGGEYQSNRSVHQTAFSQSSAFHPPLYNDSSGKKSNSSFGSMSHTSTYPYVDQGGGGGGGASEYSTTYTTLDMNNSSSSISSNNSPPEREQRSFGKVFAKDDEMNAHDYKEYTTLQPAGIGSKAASVIQDVTREGGGAGGSVVTIGNNNTSTSTNSMANANVQNTITTTTTASTSVPPVEATNERTFLLERPMAAFSPANTSNKGKTIYACVYGSKCLLHV